MKILYDGRLLTSKPSGVRDIAVGIARGMKALEDQGELEFIVATETPVDGFQNIVIRRRGFMHVGLPCVAKRNRCDLILIPRQTRPLVSVVPTRSVIHDIGFLVRPDLYVNNAAIKTTTKMVLRDRELLTISEFTKREIENRGYRGRAINLPIGANLRLSWRPQLDQKYLLCVAAQHRHKNLATLVDAWTNAETDGSSLVICANPGNDSGALLNRVHESGKSDTIRVVDGLSSGDYVSLLEGCWAYVQPSLYEGLCIPLLDALAAGVPTIGSDVGNVGVVLGHSPHGQTFNPLDVADMIARMKQVMSDPVYRASTGAWGRANVHATYWTDVARAAVWG